MAIITICSGSTPLPQFLVQFSPFSGADCPLAPCRFELCAEEETLPAGLEKVTEVGVYAFYRRGKRIVISDGRAFAEADVQGRAVHVSYPPIPEYSDTRTTFLMQQAYRYIAADAGQLQMHSAVVTYRGAGIAFCGISGAGKSTQARLWETYKHAGVINYDHPILLFDGDTVIAHGSPWGGKERYCVNRSVPLKAIFFVEQAEENAVTRMSVGESFSHLFLHNYLIPMFPQLDSRHCDTVERIAMRIPVYRLKCTASEDAVHTVYRTVFGGTE